MWFGVIVFLFCIRRSANNFLHRSISSYRNYNVMRSNENALASVILVRDGNSRRAGTFVRMEKWIICCVCVISVHSDGYTFVPKKIFGCFVLDMRQFIEYKATFFLDQNWFLNTKPFQRPFLFEITKNIEWVFLNCTATFQWIFLECLENSQRNSFTP